MSFTRDHLLNQPPCLDCLAALTQIDNHTQNDLAELVHIIAELFRPVGEGVLALIGITLILSNMLFPNLLRDRAATQNPEDDEESKQLAWEIRREKIRDEIIMKRYGAVLDKLAAYSPPVRFEFEDYLQGKELKRAHLAYEQGLVPAEKLLWLAECYLEDRKMRWRRGERPPSKWNSC